MPRYRFWISPKQAADFEQVRTSVDDRFDLEVLDLTAAEMLRTNVPAPDGVVLGLQRADEAWLQNLPASTKIIGRTGIGVDNIDLGAARRRNVGVICQPHYASAEVATHAVALLLASYRQAVAADTAARFAWESADLRRALCHVPPLEESTVGVLGCGAIGRAFIDRIAPLAGRVLAYDVDPTQVPVAAERATDTDSVLRESHFLSLHLPLTEDSHHLLDARALSLLPPRALVVNVSRGQLVDENAVAAALRVGTLSGYAADVFADEPISRDSALCQAPNALLSPHVAWLTSAAVERLARWTLTAMVRYLDGEPIGEGRLMVDSRNGAVSAPDERRASVVQ